MNANVWGRWLARLSADFGEIMSMFSAGCLVLITSTSNFVNRCSF
jgi:hypothetical protein